MCNTCGCHLPTASSAHASTTVNVMQNLLRENDRQAAHNREHFDEYGVLTINLMSSPGSGKTRLLEATIDALKGRVQIGVIEGDLETENDAQRIRAKGVPAVQITTGTACHLDAQMLHHALHDLPLGGLNLLFIENVGNLVCPASFDLGQHRNVVLLAVTEGDDKPSKYPVMFRTADLVLVTKIDLLPHLDDFAPDQVIENLHALAQDIPVKFLSSRTGDGLDAWLTWLDQQLASHRVQHPAPANSYNGKPHHHHD